MRLGGIARIQRHPDRAGDGAAEHEIGAAEVVVLQPCHPVTRLYAECAQAVGHPHAALPRLGEG